MRIVYCIPSMYRLGGIERIISRKANLLVSRGFDVCIITTDQSGRPFYFEIDERIKHYDLNINYERNRNRNILSKIFFFFYNKYLHKRRLRKILLELKADVVISTFFNELGILPEINDGSIKLVEFHFSRYMFSVNKRSGIFRIIDDYMMKLFPKILSKYSRFVVLSHEDAKSWIELDNVVVINNMCPIKIPLTSKLINKKVISVGRYEKPKGFDKLIKAWSKISEQVPCWELHIVGDGSLRSLLEKQIKEYGLENSVFLNGVSSDMGKEYLKSSIAVFTSNYEGFLMALVEAESAGVPVVSFKTPCGPNDIINNGTDGFLVENGDIDGIAEKLLILIKNEKLRKEMGKRAFENSRRFSEERIISQWISLFEEVVK